MQLGRGDSADKDSTDAESDSEEGDNINLYAPLPLCALYTAATFEIDDISSHAFQISQQCSHS